MNDLVATARAVATSAHSGQVDKNGEPYIGHPARVAARLDDDQAQAVAWLHDVVEDTAVTLDWLRSLFPAEVVEAVEAITHRPHEPRVDYYQRVRANPLAARVKLADIADNTSPERVARLDSDTRDRLTRKYADARIALTMDS